MDLYQEYRSATEPTEAMIARTQTRVDRKLQAHASVGWFWAPALILSALAVVFTQLPAPPEQIAPTGLAQGQLSVLSSRVQMEFKGEGEIQGSEHAPVIQWSRGHLHVEVEPKQGIHLSHAFEARLAIAKKILVSPGSIPTRTSRRRAQNTFEQRPYLYRDRLRLPVSRNGTNSSKRFVSIFADP